MPNVNKSQIFQFSFGETSLLYSKPHILLNIKALVIALSEDEQTNSLILSKDVFFHNPRKTNYSQETYLLLDRAM